MSNVFSLKKNSLKVKIMKLKWRRSGSSALLRASNCCCDIKATERERATATIPQYNGGACSRLGMRVGLR
jgi:hypothetical protein